MQQMWGNPIVSEGKPLRAFVPRFAVVSFVSPYVCLVLASAPAVFVSIDIYPVGLVAPVCLKLFLCS
jgi:hypothetical protein